MRDHTAYRYYQILVFDNGSEDGSANMVEAEFPDVILHRATENLGFTKAVNQAFSLCDTPLLAQVNNDVLVHKGWLTALVDCLNEKPKAGMAGGRVLFSSGETQWCGNLFGPTRMALRDWRFEPGDRQVRVNFHGPVFLVRKKAWAEVGGFDEGYSPGYSEDAELGVDLALAGWEVWFEPECRVTHLVTQTAPSFGKRKFMKIAEHHRLRFAFRNYPFSWLAIHLALEPAKMAVAVMRGYFGSYVSAWQEILAEMPAIKKRRQLLSEKPRFPSAFPSWSNLVSRLFGG